MQHMKITENLGEFQKFLKSDTKTGLCLEDTIKFFDVQRIFGQFESVKQSGIRVSMIMTTLLIMLFYARSTIFCYCWSVWSTTIYIPVLKKKTLFFCIVNWAYSWRITFTFAWFYLLSLGLKKFVTSCGEYD